MSDLDPCRPEDQALAVEVAVNEGRTVAVDTAWEEAAFPDGEREVAHRRELLLAVLASALLILVGIGGIYALNLLDQRDATILVLDQRISELQRANGSLAKEIGNLGVERSQLLETRETLTRERDGVVSERASLIAERLQMTDAINALASSRDTLTADRDRMNARVGDLDKQLIDLQTKFDESDKNLSTAKAETTRQTDRAKTAEASVAAYSQVVKLDNDINKEYATLLYWFNQLSDAYTNGDTVGFDNAFKNCVQSTGRLDTLIKQRDRTA